MVVAEDDEGLNRVICKRLERHGLKTIGVYSGADAIAAIRKHRDCLLLDFILPDMDGRLLLDKLTGQGLRVPFIVMTGRGDERIAVEMMKLGARDYIVKQVDFIDLLVPVVERVLATVATEERLAAAEQTVRLSEERLKQAQWLGRIGNWEFDLDRGTIAWSDEVHRLYERDKSLGPPTFEEEATYYSPDELLRLREFARQATEEGHDLNYDLTVNLPSGRKVFFAASMHPVKDETGRVVKLFGTVHDITERKQAEGETERHAELQAAINEMLRVSLEDLPLDSILEKSLDIITAIPWLVLDSRGSIHLVEDNPEVLVMKAQRGLAHPLLVACARVPFGRCLCGRAASTRQLVFADHLDDSHENTYDGIHDHGHYCVPMLSADQQVLGVLNLYFAAGGKRNKETEELLGVVANVLAGVVQRKRAEEDVKLKAELLDAGTDSVFLHDPAGRFLYVNEASYTTRGYTKEEFLALNLHDLDVPEQAARIEQRIAELQRNGETTFESDEFRRDRSVMPVEIHARMLNVGGRELILSVVRDITERKQAEAALAVSELQYRRVFEDSNDAMMLLDSEKFLDCNEATLKVFGYSARDEFLDKHPEQVSPPLQADGRESGVAADEERAAAVRDGRSFFEWLHQRADGTVFPADVLLTPVDYQGRKVLQATVRDITERKRAEAELLKHRDHLEELVAERTRELTAAQGQLVLQEKLATVGRVAGSVAHELRNPLGAIRNASCFLQMTVAPKLEGKPLQHLRIIDVCVERANKAITMILDFTQGRPAEPVPCALHPILQRAVTDASLPPNVEVLITIPPRLPQVLVDDGQMVVVFRNLLTNAGRAMPGGGTVKIQARAWQDEVVVDVTDTGTGVKPEHMARLFQPLFTTGGIGIGLGLSICQGFVRANKGTISVVSEVGKGTTFTVTLPKA